MTISAQILVRAFRTCPPSYSFLLRLSLLPNQRYRRRSVLGSPRRLGANPCARLPHLHLPPVLESFSLQLWLLPKAAASGIFLVCRLISAQIRVRAFHTCTHSYALSLSLWLSLLRRAAANGLKFWDRRSVSTQVMVRAFHTCTPSYSLSPRLSLLPKAAVGVVSSWFAAPLRRRSGCVPSTPAPPRAFSCYGFRCSRR